MDGLQQTLKSLTLTVVLIGHAHCDDAPSVHLTLPIGADFVSRDTLSVTADDSADATACLNELTWNPAEFSVHCEASDTDGVSATIRYVSARATGDPVCDRVAVDWYAVTVDNQLQSAPAIVVVHESGRAMTVGRAVARGLRDRGVHAFLLHLPHYGLRRSPGKKAEDQDFAVVMRQGISDVRRTHDAVRVLPGVLNGQISLQGTSLGGFVAALTAGLDESFDRVFILLAGGDLATLVANGRNEAGQLREKLQQHGYTGQKMQQLLYRFEPNRLAHRIPAERLWLYSALYDTVVPPAHADSFATAVGLHESHRIRMPANHYSGVIFLPVVLDQIANTILQRP